MVYECRTTNVCHTREPGALQSNSFTMHEGPPGRLLGLPWRSWALLVTLLAASWSLLARLACSLGLSCAIPIDLGVIFDSLGRIFVTLGSILGLPEGRI